MIPIEPLIIPHGAARVVLGATQPEVLPLPAAISADGVVMTEWELTAEELTAVLDGGRVRLWTWTYNRGFQPVVMEVTQRDGSLVESRES